VSAEPRVDCAECPRLAAYRAQVAIKNPDWFNGAVPSFGDASARLAIVGLAPGVTGANRTGRPFTGDFAGDLLFSTLLKLGLAKGQYDARPDDGLQLVDCLITNAVRCVPPENKPTPAEINQCRPYLTARLSALPKLKVIVALGRIAHDSTLKALGLRGALFPFGHGAVHNLGRYCLVDSYHCSRYNTNTGRLTETMFFDALAKASALRDGVSQE
jgi:uracil-DNA glycosylase family 4